MADDTNSHKRKTCGWNYKILAIVWPPNQPTGTMDGYIVEADEDPRIRTPHLRGEGTNEWVKSSFFPFEILLLSVNGTKCFQNIWNKWKNGQHLAQNHHKRCHRFIVFPSYFLLCKMGMVCKVIGLPVFDGKGCWYKVRGDITHRC